MSELVLAIVTAAKRDSLHWKQSAITWEELTSWGTDPATKKECGNYMMGELAETTVVHKTDSKRCTGLHRTASAVISRSALTLDADHKCKGLPDKVAMLSDWAHWVHTTHSSTPSEPRYRLVLPLSRTVTPEEYFALANVVLDRLGREQFDPTTVQPSRYMFKPAMQHPDWYESRVVDGEVLDVEEMLAEFDMAALPTPKPHHNKRDPFSLEGVVGAFNRVYEDLDELIEDYALPYVNAGADRWQLIGASSEPGVGQVAPGLFYSHHANDPAWGQTASAFDLVRLHRFADLDFTTNDSTPINRRPSHEAMLTLASKDKRVVAETLGMEFTDDPDDEDAPPRDDSKDWKLNLSFNARTGKFNDTIGNWDLIRDHDPVFSRLRYNMMTFSPETNIDLPWRTLASTGPMFDPVDRSSLAHYLEREYGVRMARSFIDELIDTSAHKHRYHPVQEYLDSLKWDGVPRVEECLPGVREQTEFTRLAARKALVAAVARVLNPGVKADLSLVLFGPEGVGKTWWISKLARGWDATLGRLDSKDTLLIMQRSWIMVADEGHSIRKADADAQKEFLTRTHDIFRMPYDREARLYPRRCVIWSTTNDEIFLRRQEGNRRFLIVRCPDQVDFDSMTPEYVDQLWAEAVHLWRSGEPLFLDTEQSAEAKDEREQYTEEDALAGLIHEWLETPVPANYESMSLEERQLWRLNASEGFEHDGTVDIDQVCTMQVWVEVLGRRIGEHKRIDLLEIAEALKSLGWVAQPGRIRVPGYGPQTVFQRPLI